MEYKLTPLEIPDENPFQNDALNRRGSIESLTTLVSELNGPFVLAIDSPWGTGKTTFIRMWKKYLESQHFVCLYFNAWESDFSTDPLVAFLGEIDRFSSKTSVENKEFKSAFEKTKRIATLLAKRALPAAGKIATAGLLDMDAFSEKAVADLVSNVVEDAVDAYSAERGLIETFHESLSEAVDKLADEDKKDNLIIFVDEIDRCRPTFAIELLERIKHLFNVPNVIFVLSTDKAQLNVSLGAVYGTDINTNEYLRRFIDLEYSLPKPDSEAFTNYLYSRFGFEEFFQERNQGELRYEQEHLIRVFRELTELLNLSLRAREQCFTRIRVGMMSTPSNYYFHPMLLVTLVVLKAAAPQIYSRYALGNGSAGEVIEYLQSIPGGNEFLKSHSGTVAECYIISAKRNRRDEMPELQKYRHIIDDANVPDEQKERPNRIFAMINEMDVRDKTPSLSYVVNKIELAAQFDR